MRDETTKGVAIIIGKGLTDIYLANQLFNSFPDLKVIRYNHSKIKNLAYYFKRLNRKGFFPAFGIKLLSIYLRLEIKVEKLRKKNIWQQIKLVKPVLNPALTIQTGNNLPELRHLAGDCRVLIITQSLKLSPAFFIRGRSILQVIGGKFPEYTGDMAIFWAAAQQDPGGSFFSVIKRHKYFRNSKLLLQCPVPLRQQDSLRVMRLKGILAVAPELPDLVSKALTNENLPEIETDKQKIRHTFTPTLFDYLRITGWGKKLKKIPEYAFKAD